MTTMRVMICLAGIIGIAGFCRAQDIDSPKFVFFGGAGLTKHSSVTQSSVHFGATLEEIPPLRAKSGPPYPGGFLFEVGYVGPAHDLGSGSAMLSVNYAGAFATEKCRHILPFFTGGYTRLFGTGNALNYGGGFDFLINHTRAVRFEARDYFRLSGSKEHNVAFRIGYIIYLAD
jgi:hypothetical protein